MIWPVVFLSDNFHDTLHHSRVIVCIYQMRNYIKHFKK